MPTSGAQVGAGEPLPGRVRTVETSAGRPPAGDVALVHDYLTQRGGAERVVLALAEAFPGAPLYTALYQPDTTFAQFSGLPVRTLSINQFSLFRRYHRPALPVLASSFAHLRLDAAVTLCSSSGWAHGVQTSGRKIVYCHTPARWLYQTDRYLDNRSKAGRVPLAVVAPALRRWDRRAAASANRYLVNSTVVKERVAKLYGIEAEVLAPPPGFDPDGPVEPVVGLKSGFILCISRLLPYKNVGSVVSAFADLPDHQLVVAGSGPLFAQLRRESGSNVSVLGEVGDAQLRWLYASCAGLVAASYEDFGLTPLEAASFGKPSATLRFGGFLDTTLEGVTGLHFEEPSRRAIRIAISQLLEASWDTEALRSHAARFSSARFSERIRQVVDQEVALA